MCVSAGLIPIHVSNSKGVSNIVIARSEATKQSILSLLGEMDCFASLAMTMKHTSAFSRRDTPELCQNFDPHKSEGAGKAGCLAHPQPPVQQKSTGVEATGSPERPAFPAQWF
jgi:hypothetical protein